MKDSAVSVSTTVYSGNLSTSVLSSEANNMPVSPNDLPLWVELGLGTPPRYLPNLSRLYYLENSRCLTLDQIILICLAVGKIAGSHGLCLSIVDK